MLTILNAHCMIIYHYKNNFLQSARFLNDYKIALLAFKHSLVTDYRYAYIGYTTTLNIQL